MTAKKPALRAAVCIIVGVMISLVGGCSGKGKECSHERYGEWEEIAATCETNGMKNRKCDYCGKEQKITILATGHKYEMWSQEKERTLSSQCKKCEHREEVELPKPGSFFNDDNSEEVNIYDRKLIKEASCEEEGVIKYTVRMDSVKETTVWETLKIAELPETLSFTEKINAKGHSFGEWKEITKPTCKGSGEEIRICSDCGHQDTREGEQATGHHWSEWETVAASSCESEGHSTHECDCCGEQEQETLPSHGHNYDVVNILPPTCTEEGKTTNVCQNETCERKEIVEVIPALGHQWSTWEGIEPTCTKNGSRIRQCILCHETEILEGENARGHVWSEWKTETHETCTTDGTESRTCRQCHEVEFRTGVLHSGHALGEWKTEILSTCTSEGQETRSCLRCAHMEVRKTAMSAHVFEGDTCNHCHAARPMTEGVQLSADGTTVINYIGQSREVYISPSVNGVNITAVGIAAFKEKQIDNVLLPDTVTVIDNLAFQKSAIKSIRLPRNILQIGDNAFKDCTKLTEVQIDTEVQLNSIGDGAFQNCSTLTRIVLPQSVEKLGASAFNDCAALQSITIPKKIVRIADHAFRGCTALTAVTFRGDIVEIGKSAFQSCQALKEIELPQMLTAIGNCAFFGCERLIKITIPKSLVTIGVSAFEGCISIVEVEVAQNSMLTDIGDYAFYGCACLIEFYSGSNRIPFEFESVNFGYDVFFETPLN